jgi:tripartite-type tricarboxylate transporter receptor subunit TctC
MFRPCEAGYGEVECGVWAGVFVPARTPKEIIMPLNHEIVKAIALPDNRLVALGFERRYTGRVCGPVRGFL